MNAIERHEGLFAALAAQFGRDEVRTRKIGGRDVVYVTARAVMNRLDDVLGPVNWWDEYQPGENSVLCKLTVRLPDGTTVTKADAGGHAGMADAGDDDKSGYSDAFKRAAVKFGVGRYLYGDGVPAFVGAELGAASPPEPAARPNGAARTDARPSRPDRREQPARQAAPREPGDDTDTDNEPRTGKALFAWIRELEDREGVKLFGAVQKLGKDRGYPTRIVDWQPKQVAEAVAEIRELLDGGRDSG